MGKSGAVWRFESSPGIREKPEGALRSSIGGSKKP